MPRDDELSRWLNSVKGSTCFKERLKIFAPVLCGGQFESCRCGRERVSSGVACDRAVEELIVRVNRLFKGSTVYDAQGSWMDGGRLVVEPVKVIEVAHSCVDEERARKLADAIRYYAENMHQVQMGISEGNFYLSDVPELAKSIPKRYVQTRFPRRRKR